MAKYATNEKVYHCDCGVCLASRDFRRWEDSDKDNYYCPSCNKPIVIVNGAGVWIYSSTFPSGWIISNDFDELLPFWF